MTKNKKDIYNGLLLYALTDEEINKLKRIVKTMYSKEEMTMLETNGFYETVGEYCIFPDKDTLKNRTKNLLKR